MAFHVRVEGVPMSFQFPRIDDQISRVTDLI